MTNRRRSATTRSVPAQTPEQLLELTQEHIRPLIRLIDRLNEAGAEDELKVISRQLTRLYFRAAGDCAWCRSERCQAKLDHARFTKTGDSNSGRPSPPPRPRSGRRAAHSMRDSAQVTAPGAVTSRIVAVSTRLNRQNRSTRSRMSVPLVQK